jgi:hypothetical protein
VLLDLRIVARLCLGRRNVSDRLQQSLVEPVFKRGELHLLEAVPQSAPPDYLCLVESVDRLGERVVFFSLSSVVSS